MPTNIYTAGINNVGSYQVAGIPYLTSSAIVNQEKRFSFPFVCKSITIHNTGSNDIYFRFSEDVDAHFKLPSSKIVTLDAKASAIFVSGSTATGIQLYASLTNLDRNLIPPEATLFSTASSGGGAPLPPTEPFTDSDGDGVSDEDEIAQGSDPNDPDTDKDGLLDGEDSTPLSADGDGDGTATPSDSNDEDPEEDGTPVEQLPVFAGLSALTRKQNASAPGGDLETFLLGGVSATDFDGGTVTNISVVNLDFFTSLTWSTVKDYEIEIQAIDSADRIQTAFRELKIVADTAPVINIALLSNIELGTANASVVTTLSGSVTSVDDDVDTIATGSVSISHDYDVATAAHGDTITINYSVTDSFGNTGTNSQTVLVQDTVAPAFNSFSDLSFVVGATPSEAQYLSGVSATDESSVTLSVDSTAEDTSATGTYTIQITATDAVGNATTVSRTVNITNTSRPVIYPNRIADSSKRFGGLVAGFGNYLVNSSNGGKQPPIKNNTGVTSSALTTNKRNDIAYHSGTQSRLELTGTAYGNAATASFTFNSEFTSNVLELDGTGDYIQFPEVPSTAGVGQGEWKENFIAGSNRYDLGPMSAFNGGTPPYGNRYAATIGWFKLDALPSSTGTYTIMNKRDETGGGGAKQRGYDIKLVFQKTGDQSQAKITYETFCNTAGGGAVNTLLTETGFKDVSTDLWYMFRITSQEAGTPNGIANKLRTRAVLWAQNETASAALQVNSMDSQDISPTINGTGVDPLRIGSHVNDGQAFNGKFFRIYRWYALEGASFDAEGDFSSTSFAGGLQDSVVAANMNLDNLAAIKASSTDTFADPGATAVNGETVYSNWETVMGSANGPYGSTTPNLSTQGINKYYLIEYSASNGEGTGYGYRVVRIQS